MTPAFPYDAESAASLLVSRLEPASVLLAGTFPADLEEALRRRGVDAVSTPDLAGARARWFDLIVCAGTLDGAGSAEALRAATMLAARSSRLLLGAREPELEARLAGFGYAPDAA
ncbi:MAG TPA: hypothetical protein VHA11_08165, partial [Bryobacteraceae bacterium]|nr:hypothetical protein [Bryobacteraceae bacterium]